MKSIKSYLTRSSVSKHQLYNAHSQFHPRYQLHSVLQSMITAFNSKIEIFQNIPEIDKIKNRLIKFDQETNDINGSDFQKEINNMKYLISFTLITRNGNIRLNFLSKHRETNYISAVLHAINTFCNFYEASYHNLEIDICLNDHQREVSRNLDNPKEIDRLKKKSMAMNVSGITNSNLNYIIITRKEEIIKLLYHELIHYAKIDNPLRGVFGRYHLATSSHHYNLSETYTEFLSIILTVAYYAIHLAGLTNKPVTQLFNRMLSEEIDYSIYLVSNFLKHYGYDCNNFMDFFNGIGQKKYSPIYLWEYVFLRTQLLIHMEEVLDMLDDNLVIKREYISKFIDILTFDDTTLGEIKRSMCEHPISYNVSYMMYDLNWNSV